MAIYNRVEHLFSLLNNSPVERWDTIHSDNKKVTVDIKRDDLIHPIISGNKWRKLKYLLMEIESLGYTKVAAMGGSHSNFLHSLSYVCFLLGWDCQLHVRGYPQQALSPTLLDCVRWKAKIRYVDRVTFREIRQTKPKLDESTFWIAEGGQHRLALKGISELFCELHSDYDYLCMASATGTSIAGLVAGAKKYQSNCKVIGISVLNNTSQQVSDVISILKVINNQQTSANQISNKQTEIGRIESVESNGKWQLIDDYGFGGFAKKNLKLVEFCQAVNVQKHISIEPVYSGKSFYGVIDLMQQDFFEKGSRVLVVHCGGMQGARQS